MGGGIAEGDSAEAPEGSETGETETDSRSNRVPGLRSLQSRNKHLLRLAQSYEKKIALLQAELDAQSKAVLIGTDTRAHSVTVHSPGKENRDQQSSKGDIPSSQPTPVESVEIIMGADPITRLTSEDSQLTHFFSDSRGPTSSSRIGPQILPNPNPNPILSSSLSPSADADVDADTEDVNLQSILAALGEVENAVLSARQGEVAQRSVQFSATLSQYLSKAEAQNMVVSAREGDRRMIQELSSEVKRLVALLPRGLVDPEEGEAEAEVAGERVLGVGLRGIGKGAGWLIGGEAETEGVEAEAKIGAGAEEEEESGEEEEGESEEEVSSQPPIGAHMLKSPTINAYSSGAVVMSFCFGLIAMMICFAISALLLPVPIPIMPQK
ncbi:hypothetical protein B484DRAFT_395146 [Ochromonadaceae sp. CCMP2298]|nr:hypothetical protein B484DRAFT_395146 [Ochromonadaceae sp. CCMP2298]